MASLGYITRAVADVLLPRQCAVCGRKLLVRESHICTCCLADIPQTYNWNTAQNPMAETYNAMIQRDIDTYESYAYAAGLFFFRSGSDYRNICYNLKYHGNTALGRHFSRILGKRIATSPLFRDVDAVIPVPLHWMRRLRRGYNQAEVIARELAHALDAPLRIDILKRNRRTKTQTRLDVEHKRLNVSSAFGVKSSFMKHVPTDTGIHHIMLVDDVFTTGATINACHKALRKIFPPEVRISAVTLAVVGK